MRYRTGDVVRVEFDDHCVNHKRPMQCVVYGRVHKLTRKYLVVDTWHLKKNSEPRQPEDNTECCVIVRSAVLKVTKMVPCA